MHSTDVCTIKSSSANRSVAVGARTLRALTGSASNGGVSGLLKVLFVTNMYPDDDDPGAGAFVRQQAEHLRKAGHQVDVFHVQNNRSRLNTSRPHSICFGEREPWPMTWFMRITGC